SVVREEACARLIDHIAAKYLISRTATRLVRLGQWRSLIQSLGRHLSSEQRSHWAENIKAGYASGEEDLKALKFGQVKSLGRMLAEMDKKAGSGLMLAWLAANDQAALADVSAKELAGMASLLSLAEPAKRAEMINRFDQHWEASHASEPLKWKECVAISVAWRRMRDKDKAKTWATRAYQVALGTQEARAEADAETLEAVADALRLVGLTGKGTGYAGFATAAARLAREGKLPGQGLRFYYTSAFMLGTPETVQTVQAELVDGQGKLRLGVAKLLTQVHASSYGDIKVWRAYVDGRLAASADGDAKALWLLAKARVEPATRAEPMWALAKPWLNQAMAEAISGPVRLAVVGEFRTYYKVMGRPDVAAGMLGSVKGQFTGAELATVDGWLKEARDSAESKASAAARKKAARAVRRKELRLEYYRKRLAVAESGGDSGKAARLRAAIGRLTAVVP
ncbi:hypothetical protein LCGC14_2637980, partial [marine sediment metagenome]